MSDLAFDDPCLLFPLRREARAFLREFPPQQRFPGAPCPATFCGPAWLTVLIVETGIGGAATQTALDWVLSKPVFGNVPYEPKVILSAGFAGALQANYRVGDLLLATEVADVAGNRWPATWPGDLPPGEWRPPLHRGMLLTVSRLVNTPDEKRSLAQQSAAAAVDMESATVARLCGKKGVPFGCLRAVSDDIDTGLSPKLATLVSGGRISPFKALSAVAASPKLAGEMWRLAKQTRHAGEQLGKALGELLTLTLPFSLT